MNSSPNINDARAQLEPIIDALESERKNAQARTMSSLNYIVPGVVVMTLIAMFFNGRPSFFHFVIFSAIGGAIFYFINSQNSADYRNGFKFFLLPKLVAVCAAKIDGDLQYESQSGIEQQEFCASDLFGRCDRYKSEDLIKGHIGKTALRMSEVHAERKQARNESGGKNDNYCTTFKGLFFVADFNKNFNGITQVKPDLTHAFFGRYSHTMQKFGTSLTFSPEKLVELEDPEFDRLFAVYSTDQIEARYILSPSLMSRLTKFRARCNTDIYLSFQNSSVIVAIPLAITWLEAPPISQPLSMNTLRGTLAQLDFALGIVADLDLNTRLWNKA